MEDLISRARPCICGCKPLLEDFAFGDGKTAIRAFCRCGRAGATVANDVLTVDMMDDAIDAWNAAIGAPGALH